MSTISAGTKFGLVTVTGATLTVSATRLRKKAEMAGGNPDDIGLFCDGQALC